MILGDDPANRDEAGLQSGNGDGDHDDTEARTPSPTWIMLRWRRVVAGLAIVAIVAAVLLLFSGKKPERLSAPVRGDHGKLTAVGAVGEPAVWPRPVDPATLEALPKATTYETISAAPRDPAPRANPSGHVVHPNTILPVFAEPGGTAIASVQPQQLGGETWLPVVAERRGWAQVLLPSRPNGSTGWIHVADPRIDHARTTYRIHVDRAGFLMRLLNDGAEVGRWTVDVGKRGAVTPVGRTFLLASIEDTAPTFSPIVLPLGSHSDTHLTYGGGPGTVAIHGWPTPVFGRASSDGCIRVPPDALNVIATQVPIGTPVMVE